MINTLFALLTAQLISHNTVQATMCMSTHTSSIAKMTLECIEKANPKSDEEPEHWIWVCHGVAVKTYCPHVVVYYSRGVSGTGVVK